jgi:hypothetical protein
MPKITKFFSFNCGYSEILLKDALRPVICNPVAASCGKLYFAEELLIKIQAGS